MSDRDRGAHDPAARAGLEPNRADKAAKAAGKKQTADNKPSKTPESTTAGASDIDPTGTGPPNGPGSGSNGRNRPSDENPEVTLARVIARWTRVMGVCAVLALITSMIGASVAGFQWHEMHTGGIDTHQLALAAQSSALAASEQAAAMSSLASSTENELGAVRKTADAAKAQADSLAIQASASQAEARGTARMLDTIRDTARRQLRAYLSRSDVTVEPIFATAGTMDLSWQLTQRIRNSGPTPTRILTIRAICGTGHSFSDAAWRASPPSHKQDVGGGAELIGATCTFDAAELDANIKHRYFEYMVSDLRYRDIYGESRRTIVCDELHISGNAMTPAVSLPFFSLGCPMNCEDEECKTPGHDIDVLFRRRDAKP